MELDNQKIHFQILKNSKIEAQIIFQANRPGVLNKDPTVWLNGARSPQNAFASIIKLANWSSDYFSGQLAKGSQ